MNNISIIRDALAGLNIISLRASECIEVAGKLPEIDERKNRIDSNHYHSYIR